MNQFGLTRPRRSCLRHSSRVELIQLVRAHLMLQAPESEPLQPPAAKFSIFQTPRVGHLRGAYPRQQVPIPRSLPLHAAPVLRSGRNPSQRVQPHASSLRRTRNESGTASTRSEKSSSIPKTPRRSDSQFSKWFPAEEAVTSGDLDTAV